MGRTGRHVVVSGRVQGVGFRWWVQRGADELGLAGWVRNLADGRVEACLEGDEEAVERMVERLREGPAPARVANAVVREVPAEGRPCFEIRPTGVG